jgi:chorismate mutase
MVRAVRGAITCDERHARGGHRGDPGTVTRDDGTKRPGPRRRDQHHLHDDSRDLTSAFPATCARGIGFGDIPLLCASEINVPGAMPKCIRMMMHAYTPRARADVRHVYLRNAQSLRDDLPG